MAVNSTGTEMLRSAHGVDVLLEHQSTPSIELVDRMAVALRNDVTVIIRADKDSRVQHILKTMQAIKESGFRKVQLRAQIEAK